MKKQSKIILIVIGVLFILSLLCCGILFFSFNNTWLGGTGCLYDDGKGFIEMKDQQVLNLEDGKSVKCERGKLVFN